MKLELFKPEDFMGTYASINGPRAAEPLFLSPNYAANIANAKLNEWFEQQPVVTGDNNSGDGWAMFQNANPAYARHTHTARLVCIEPIVKDTAESLMRDLVGMLNEPANEHFFAHLKRRARKLLEGK